jgi:hypothetical protein
VSDIDPRDELSTVVATGGRRETLNALLRYLAEDLEAARNAIHRRDCVCHCGMGDIRAKVALQKAIREIKVELSELPEAAGVNPLDELDDQVAQQRAKRRPAASGM